LGIINALILHKNFIHRKKTLQLGENMLNRQMIDAIELLTNTVDLENKTNCNLQILKHLRNEEKIEFVADLNKYERIGLLTCYRICIEKII